MIIEKIVRIEIVCHLEIDTDKVPYGVHGGAEYPAEIVEEAVHHYGQEVDYTVPSMEDIDIRVLKTRLYSIN